MMLLALPFQLQAATLLLPATPASATSPNPTALALTVGVASVYLDGTNAGTASSGAYDLTATGGTRISVVALGTVRLQAHTTVDSTGIKFGTSTIGNGGLLSSIGTVLTNTITAGLVPQWSATIDLSDLGLNLVPNGTYEFKFNLAQTASLLGNIAPAVLNRFSVSVEDTVGTINAQVLGLTDLTSTNGTATFRFTTGATVNDPSIRLSGSALLNTSLLGGLLGQTNPDLYTVSALNLTPVPEPDVFLLFGMVGIVLIFRRRA